MASLIVVQSLRPPNVRNYLGKIGRQSYNEIMTSVQGIIECIPEESVLSGLLICAECEHNYRRITRPSGEVVWRCANRVEHGKKFCKHSPTIPEETVKTALCEKLDLNIFDENKVKSRVDFILIQPDGSLQIELQSTEYFELLPN